MNDMSFRILLVDDSAPFRRQIGSALTASGLVVLEATEGVEALWRARSAAPFDLVLLDIHLPNLSGRELLRELRQLPGYAAVPIIVVTSDGSRERRLEGLAAGATAWLLKPLDPPVLVNAVHAALARASMPVSRAPAERSLTPAARSFTPAARSFTPVARSFTPAARSFTPAARSLTPMAGSLTPVERDTWRSPAAVDDDSELLTPGSQRLLPRQPARSTSPGEGPRSRPPEAPARSERPLSKRPGSTKPGV